MNNSGHGLCWRELLSPAEIRAWIKDRKLPARLRSDFACPGVYRFTFREFTDENGSHTACYVGQSGDLVGRLPWYFRPAPQAEKRDENGDLILESGWHARGAVQNSDGEFDLQVLAIEGAVTLGGVVLNQHSFSNPFARVLLENWAILSSEQIDHLRPSNRGISQEMKDLQKLLRAASNNSLTDSSLPKIGIN